MKFPIITKNQIFNIKVKNYNQIFKCIQGYGDNEKILYWNIVEYGDEWYLNPAFWIDFVDRIYEVYGYLQLFINNGSKKLVMEFFIDFKKQILYGEAFSTQCQLELPLINRKYLEEDDTEFLERFFNEEKIIKPRRI